MFLYIFLATILSSCATVLTYKPTANPNVLDAMQSIKEKILTQSGVKSPYFAEVTENTLTVKGNFEGAKIEGDKSTGLINFKEITDMVFHHKRDWFMVTLVSNNNSKLYRYYSSNEDDAKKFMDDIYTMIQHKVDPNHPIALINKPILNRSDKFTKKDLNYAD